MMELPSMVQRSGDTLIVRSVVSGNQLYLDQGGVKGAIGAAGNSNNLAGAVTHNPSTNSHHYHHNSSTSALEQQFEMYRAAAAAAQQQQQHYLQQQHQQQQQGGTHTTAQQQANAAALELKDEGLPQCKIKRNYSCSYCTYFTQNPRYHLTHLRDVHGEKIVINNCKLCLYASRHFQKLVRHMKMVHGCTDGIAGGHGQSRGKRGMSREARKRKLEQSVGIGGGVGVGVGMANVANSGVPEMPTLEEVKRELELQQAAFNKQQANHKTQQMLANQMTTNAIIAAYEQELRERKLESLKVRSTYEQQEAALPANIEAQRQRQSPTNHNNSYNNNNGGNVVSGFQLPLTKRNLELSPSPTGSASSPSPAAVGGTGTPSSSSTPTPHNTSAALSLSYVDEPPQNRLLKCSICDFTTLYRAQLMTHELDEHCKTKFFRCEKCSYVTHIKTRFSKHVKYHSMPMIKCVTCDFRTPYKWNLDRHMKNHGGAGPFKCAACDFTADIKQSLTVHEMNHHVPPVGHAAGMSLARRRNKVGGTDLCEDFLSDSAEMMEDHYNNNNLEEYDEAMLAADGDGDPDGMIVAESYNKKCKYNDDEEPTDLSQKGGSSDTSSVHNQALTPKAKRPVPNLIPIPKVGNNVLNLSKDLAASRSSLTDIASMFFSEKQLSEMLQPLDKSDAPQLSPTTTITSSSSHNSRSLLHKKPGSFFDKLKSSALTNSGGPSENLICPCGHMAKCLSESIIHRKTCNFAAIADDDIEVEEEEQDDGEGRLEIDFAADDDDKQSHSALNLVTGSTRCQHCRHRCKSSADLLNHLKHCTEAARCGNESYDSLSGESSTGRGGADSAGEQLQHPMENRVFIWNKMPRGGSSAAGGDGSQCSDGQHRHSMGESSAGSGSSGGGMGNNEENSYYGVETAPGYGEVTKKMTPEEEAANSSLKKVYKCPHCSFWASTASRFHVHIVGHLNKKPFECSLCSYRSNWRWDITKHIRLKTIRDPSHKNARVLMNDETGRRNYTKYNKYITLMKVTEEDGDPKLMKSGEMTPNQVASLSFLNDFNKTSGIHLNGLRDDVTLEPVHTPKSSTSTDAGAEQMSDRFIRLPLLATMVNAAMTQHQQQQQKKQHEQQHTTLITPSVTISAVKRSPPHLLKPSDDLVTDVKQEGNEKKTFYRCRKCSFRHGNRDAVLAHVRIHYQDSSYASALATSSKSAAANGAQQPLQVAVNSNLYNMNEVLAAMCLSQQQQQQQNSNSPSSNAQQQQQQQQQQQHSMLSAGLLQQAMQGASSASPNSPLSGLALALTGKSPTKSGNAATAATILEHGEQKASQNEASAPRRPPPTSPNTHTQAASIATAAPIGGSAFGGNVAGATSLQHLLSSPRDSTHHTHALAHAHNRPLSSPPATTTTLIGAGINYNQNNNSNLVMGLTGAGAGSNANSPTAQQQQLASSSSCLLASPQSPTSAAGSPIVTTFPTTPTRSGAAAAAATTPLSAKRMGAFGASPRLHAHNALPAGVSGMQGLIAGDSVCFGGLVYGSNSSTLLQCNSTTTTTTTTPSTTISTPSTSTNSCNLLSNSSAAATALAAKNPSSSNASSSSSSTSSPSSSTSATNFINNNNNNLNNSHNMNNSNNASNSNNLLSNDSERRDPSPYRCGHCHQVSNWKHVIQRHCRLKHAGDIRIETLDRAACVERNAAPIYRPLGSGASNETNYGLSFKALQHQQQQPPPPSPHHQQQHQQQQQQQKQHANLNNKSNNNNSVLMSKHNEHMLHSPLTSSAAAAAVNAANTPQDLQAAAAYLAAAYKAAHANAASGAGTAEELLLQQNDQIEITRLPPAGATNLVQLLESANASVAAAQPNSKCKQQKCPLCPYISESKSQMNYHISLHKPTQYECQLCTFVCAKKQHLSNHMRSVHQQQLGSGGAAPQSHNLNLDFSMALQLAAAAQAQQDAAALSTPLAIDLSALKHTTLNTGGQCNSAQPQHAAPAAEQQPRFVSYCAKCPARFVQQHSEVPHSSSTELEQHLKCHCSAEEAANAPNTLAYSCEFCDFRAAHETLIQTHRYVHSQHYQDKCAARYKSCREDVAHAAPKLMQITLTKNLQSPETVWIVDLELSGNELKQQQQLADCSSLSNLHASTSNFEGGNSLLKKQLEAGPAPIPTASSNLTRNCSPSPQAKAQPDADDSCSNTHSTSASVATSDLAADAGSDFASATASPAPLEKCLHCPYESNSATAYKAHLQHHICISQQEQAYTCEHCDYSVPQQQQIEEHTRVHFNAMEKLKSVAFFTSYDNLELSVKQEASEEQQHADTTNLQHTENVSIKQEQAQEHNNNNEEDAVNENMLQEQQQQQEKAIEKSDDAAQQAADGPLEQCMEPAAVEAQKKTCTKIILYKNDGCLSIKKDGSSASVTSNNNNNSVSGDNISDRLRRRISRSSNSHHLNNGVSSQQSSNDETHPHHNHTHTHSHHHQPPQQQQSHKTILVNAKTGQVISRN